jgi:hypothetical protein
MRKLTITILALTALTGAAFAQTTADVQIIHNSPDPLAAEVDIYINGDLTLDDFAFRAATPILQLPAEVELAIGVAPGSSTGPEDIIATFPVTLMSDEEYLVMATGVLDGTLPGNPEGLDTAFTLNIWGDLETMAAAGEVDLNIYHGSPNAPTVDVQVMMGAIIVDDLAYGEFTGYIEAPAVDLILEVTPGSDNETVVAAFEAPLSALDGGAGVVFASGFLGDDMTLPAFGLFVALGDGTVIELNQATVSTEAQTLSGVKSMFE